MSRLNATIKLLFVCGELLFLLASLFCVLASGIIASGYIPAFTFPLAKKNSIIVLLVSGAALVCSCFGCCAVLRQTKRRGCFSGRRMLVSNSLYCLDLSSVAENAHDTFRCKSACIYCFWSASSSLVSFKWDFSRPKKSAWLQSSRTMILSQSTTHLNVISAPTWIGCTSKACRPQTRLKARHPLGWWSSWRTSAQNEWVTRIVYWRQEQIVIPLQNHAALMKASATLE